MGFKYKGICYETQQEFHQTFAQDACAVQIMGSTAVSHYVYCTADATNVYLESFIYTNNLEQSVANTHAFKPQVIPCTYTPPLIFSSADMIQLAWLIIGVWVVAWALKKSADAIRNKS